MAVPPARRSHRQGALAEAIFDGQDYNPLLIPTRGLTGYKTFELKDKRLSLGIRATAEDFETVNVAGLVPGTDPAREPGRDASAPTSITSPPLEARSATAPTTTPAAVPG